MGRKASANMSFCSIFFQFSAHNEYKLKSIMKASKKPGINHNTLDLNVNAKDGMPKSYYLLQYIAVQLLSSPGCS